MQNKAFTECTKTHSSCYPRSVHQYIQKTTQKCTFWLCLPLTTVWFSWMCRIAAPYKFRVELKIEHMINDNLYFTTYGSITTIQYNTIQYTIQSNGT